MEVDQISSPHSSITLSLSESGSRLFIGFYYKYTYNEYIYDKHTNTTNVYTYHYYFANITNCRIEESGSVSCSTNTADHTLTEGQFTSN